MASTIQTIETPKRARALDTSSGWQVVSGNLITNGDFATGDFTGWTSQASDGTATISSGAARLDATPADSGSDGVYIQISQNILTQGKSYRVTFDITNHNGETVNSRVIDVNGNLLYRITGNGTGVTFDFTHEPVDNGYLYFRADDAAGDETGSKYDIDNIVVQEIRNFSNNNHGQIYSGRALEFDGVTDYLDTGLVFHPEPNHTIAVWVKANSDGNWKMLVDGRDAGDDGIKLTFQNDDQIEYSLNTVDVITVDSGLGKFADRWVRIVATYDGSTAKIYVNGIKAEMHPSYTGESITPGNFNTTTTTWKIGRKAYGAENYFDGFMSDVQIWNTAWTQDDVTYDYLNPESLALNRSGTSLTNSNLKMWYPMQDGHRGQQSYVLDASNTGLGDNMLTDRDGNYYGDVEGLTATTRSSYDVINNAAGYEVFTGYQTGASVSLSSDIKYSGSHSLKVVTDSTVSNSGVYTAKESTNDRIQSVVSGVTYRVSGYIYRESGSGSINVYVKKASDSTNWGMDGKNITPSSNGVWQSWESYYTSGESGDGAFILFSSGSTTETYYLDNIKYEPVNDKNNATTVFYGDELWDANDHTVGWTGRQHILETKNREFTTASDWTEYSPDGTAPTFSSGGTPAHLEVTGSSSASNKEGAQLATSFFTTPIVGQQYRVAAKIWWDDGSDPGTGAIFRYGFGGGLGDTFDVAAESKGTVYTSDIIATSTIGVLRIYKTGNVTEKWNIDDVSIVQIGTPIDSTNEGVSLPYVGHTTSTGATLQLRDSEKLNTDLTVGRTYRLSGLFATDVAGAVNAPQVGVYTGGNTTWYYDDTPTVPATNLLKDGSGDWGTMEENDHWNTYGDAVNVGQSTKQVHNGTYSFKFEVPDDGINDGIQSDTFTVTADTTYLLSAWIFPDDTTTITMKILQGDGSTLSESITGLTENAWNHVVRQYRNTTAGSGAAVRFQNTGTNTSGSVDTYYIDDVVYTAFLERNIDFIASHATDDYVANLNKAMSGTDSMIYRKNTSYSDQDFNGGSTNWAVYDAGGSSSAAFNFSDANDNATFTTTTDTQAEGAQLAVANFETLEIGRYYTIQIALGSNTGSPTVYIGLGGAESHGRVINTTPGTEYAFTVGPVTDITSPLRVYTKENVVYTITMDGVQIFENCTLYYDDISVKEIGTASGWTDADQQLHIPQTALQSYNEFAWFGGFDTGTDSDITIADNAALDNIFDGGGSVSAWFFAFDDGAGGYGRIMDKDHWYLYTKNESGGNMEVAFTMTTDGTGSTTKTSTRIVKAGRWYHVVATFNSSTVSSQAIIYLNGEATPVTESSNGSGTRNDDDGEPLFIGNVEDGTRTFAGAITECSLWTNVLTQAEVNELYNGGKALDATTHSSYVSTPANLKGYWRNNGLSTWTDLSDNSNNGTVNNITETMLIPQGVDSSRDSQGFIMNRQRNTSSLNFPPNNDGNYRGSGMEVYNTKDNTLDGQFDSSGDGLGDFTIEFWFKTNQVLSSGSSVLYQSASYSAPNWTGLDIQLNSDGAVGASCYTDASNSVIWGNSGGSGVDYNDGDWHHVVLVVDRSTKSTLIIDKVVKDIQTSTVADNTSIVLFKASQRIGSSTSAFQATNRTDRQAFEGQIDGFKIYKDLLTFDTADGSINEGETITSGEVLRNYNATKGSHRN